MLLLGIPNEILPEAGQHGLQASRRPSVFLWPVGVFMAVLAVSVNPNQTGADRP